MTTTNFNVGTLDFDFSKLFVPLSKGGTAYPTATGYKLSDGQDLNEVFAAIGTVNALGTVNATVANPTGFLLSDGKDLADIFNGEAIITYTGNVVKSSVGLWDYYTVTDTVNTTTITIKSDYDKTFGYMAVAGGGGNSNSSNGGGGGGGGFLDGSLNSMRRETITINIGAGGTIGTSGKKTTVSFSNGSNSIIDCVGGGFGGFGGGFGSNGSIGGFGGSGGGGGGGTSYKAGGSATLGQGYGGGISGRLGSNNLGGGGGGGGAGGAGGAGSSGGASTGANGAGGAGKTSNYSGTNLVYARGSKGGNNNNVGVSGIFVLAVLR